MKFQTPHQQKKNFSKPNTDAYRIIFLTTEDVKYWQQETLQYTVFCWISWPNIPSLDKTYFNRFLASVFFGFFLMYDFFLSYNIECLLLRYFVSTVSNWVPKLRCLSEQIEKNFGSWKKECSRFLSMFSFPKLDQGCSFHLSIILKSGHNYFVS